MKIKPINHKLKPLLERFLSDESLQPRFSEISKKLGYKGDDPIKIKTSLFTPNNTNDICFASKEVEDLFVEYQILEQLNTIPFYKELLEKNPEAKPGLINLCKDILNNNEIDIDKILSIVS